jgi:hypothetical protein
MQSEKVEQEIKDEPDVFDFDPYQENDDKRLSIDTAIQVFQFLDTVDANSPEVLRWQLKNKVKKTRKICLKAILELSEELLATEEEKTEEDED